MDEREENTIHLLFDTILFESTFTVLQMNECFFFAFIDCYLFYVASSLFWYKQYPFHRIYVQIFWSGATDFIQRTSTLVFL
jgi:hypothetical protein